MEKEDQKILDLSREIILERDLLLLEHQRLESITEVLEKRNPKAGPSKNSPALDQAAIKSIRGLLRGGMLHRGVFRIEQRSFRYMEELKKKLDPLVEAFEVEGEEIDLGKLEKQLTVYEKELARLSSPNGAIAQAFQETPLNWAKLKKEVDGSKKCILSLLSLLEGLTIKKGMVLNTFMIHLEGQGFPQFLCKYKYVEYWRFLFSHWDEIKEHLPPAELSYRSTFFQLIQILHISIEKNELTLKNILPQITILSQVGNLSVVFFSEALEKISSQKLLNDKVFNNVSQGMISSGSDNFAKFYTELLYFFAAKNKIPLNKSLDLCEATVDSRALDYFNGVYSDYDVEIQNFFAFCENLLLLCKKEKIQYTYGIDRGGRIINLLFYSVLRRMGLGKKVKCYYLFANREGKVILYSYQKKTLTGTVTKSPQEKEIYGKNILLVDEYFSEGKTIAAAEAFIKQKVGPGKVISAIYSSSVGGYYSVSTMLPSWYEKKEYSGFAELEGGGVKVNPAFLSTARAVRTSLYALSKVIAKYLKLKGY